MKITFCRCGRIHITPKVWDWIAEDHENRSVVHICTHCGNTLRMWLDPYEDGFATNAHHIEDDEFEGNIKVIVSSGIRVDMKSGTTADNFISGYFVNCNEWNEMESKKGYINIESEYKNGEKWTQVDTNQLIKDIKLQFKDKAEEVLKELSAYSVKIDWTGTPYERKYN